MLLMPTGMLIVCKIQSLGHIKNYDAKCTLKSQLKTKDFFYIVAIDPSYQQLLALQAILFHVGLI